MVDLTSPGKGASDPNSYSDFPREIEGPSYSKPSILF